MHRHRAKSQSADRCFSGCARPTRCCQAAHGNITFTQTCSCGATREVNLNGRHVETGEWQEQED